MFVLFAPMAMVIPALLVVGIAISQEQKQNLTSLRDEVRYIDTSNRQALHGCVQRLQSREVLPPSNPFHNLDVNEISDRDLKRASNAAKTYARPGYGEGRSYSGRGW